MCLGRKDDKAITSGKNKTCLSAKLKRLSLEYCNER